MKSLNRLLDVFVRHALEQDSTPFLSVALVFAPEGDCVDHLRRLPSEKERHQQWLHSTLPGFLFCFLGASCLNTKSMNQFASKAKQT